MGLLTIIKKQKLKDKEIRVLMLGLDNSGKTTIVKKILNEDVNEVSPTLGFNIRTVTRGQYKLNIWDIGGQKTLRPFWRNYFEKTDFMIWVVDASATDRLHDCRKELQAILNEDRLVGAGVLIWINKLDLVDPDQRDKTVERISGHLDLDQIPEGHNTTIMGCSAYTGYNLDAGMDLVVKEVSERLFLFD
ncbi:ADP-ribosylation factor family-domain-containing protein [Yarrowia lipolytica]|uniref:Abnormal eversion of vulva protein 20 n=2 Tax=Yarrowia lipolytica TaxID=4952 RepID=B5FVF4_YARLI|nr:YALI0E23793p [Yarrowia lipolytica CLIB122]AOW05873.1 hypothetical protein YALI1_E28156g [Yarrowia lipolytica]KAB8285923.1 ADP-ribosylation factor family-domain-containing protein [Yarrowia lipolytica]KAE8172526.1 ADP-ribosylation factor family-domain-containing protein [Yarrowia lipolytica]KAJ8057302.1 ADP-ribosylation factor family-domain-containing protein [Yarrowia lipolytica]QNP99162.1 ADP-ribosylation factor-like protein 2 [Yarrowia lipolytica]|eukprot:XP_002143083.1 YALI0E23793p [Yarrowia lipolytica CLIB122]